MAQAKRYEHLYSLRKQDDLDCYYQAAFYLLSTSQPVYDRAKKYVDREGINFAAIKNNMKGMTLREKQIIRISENLFKGGGACMVTPADLVYMGQPLLDDVVNAIYIAAGQATVQVSALENGILDLEIDMSKYHRLHRERIAMERFAASIAASAQEDELEVG